MLIFFWATITGHYIRYSLPLKLVDAYFFLRRPNIVDTFHWMEYFSFLTLNSYHIQPYESHPFQVIKYMLSLSPFRHLHISMFFLDHKFNFLVLNLLIKPTLEYYITLPQNPMCRQYRDRQRQTLFMAHQGCPFLSYFLII